MPIGNLAEKALSSSAEDSSSEESVESDTEVMGSIPGDENSACNLQILYNAALMLRQDTKSSKGMGTQWPPTSSQLTLDAAETAVPVALYNFFAWVMGESDDPTLDQFVTTSNAMHFKLISIAQDFIYIMSKGKKPTPKSYALGLATKHLTGSTQVIELLNKFGHCISSQTVTAFETALAQLQINKQDSLPQNCQKEESTILVWDNIDFNEETVTGHGTTHHTNGIITQRKSSTLPESIPHGTIDKRLRTLSGHVQSLQHYSRKKRHGPMITCDESIYADTQFESVQHAGAWVDFLYVAMKTAQVSPGMIPAWTGFNTLLSKNEARIISIITYLPVIEASPTEMDTVYTILKKSSDLADKLSLKEIVVVFDLAIYAKAQEIRWSDVELSSRLVLRLGEFHTSMSFLSVIGKRFRDAGLFDLLVEAELAAHGSVNAVIDGRHYNRSMRCHKVVFEALCRLRLQSFLNCIPEEEKNAFIERISNLCDVYPSAVFDSLSQSEQLRNVWRSYQEFVTTQNSSSKTFAFWSSYIDIVGLLLQFIRATRTSDWQLHLSTLRSMMPWYYAYDHVNYARFLPAYWLEMLGLSTSHPSTYQEFLKGKWTVHRQSRYGFSGTACDQIIEQTVNRDSKTRGGIRGYTLQRNAVQRWILSQPERAAITRQCKLMAGCQDSARSRKDLDLSSATKNDKSVENVVTCILQMINPFDDAPEDLVNICSGLVATPTCARDLEAAKEKGESSLVAFMSDRITSRNTDFHAPIKKLKLETFSTKSTNGKKQKEGHFHVESDRKLFTRLLLLGKSKQVDLREMLTYSLGSVSFPLASADGSLAKTKKSSLIDALLQKWDGCVAQSVPAQAALIIDGMALVQAIPQTLMPATFEEFAWLLLHRVMEQVQRREYGRVDVVFDTYPAVSIKSAEHCRRQLQCGQGQRRTIYGGEQKVPKQWKSFLRDGMNKESLIEFVASAWRRAANTGFRDIEMFVTHGTECEAIRFVDGEACTRLLPSLASDHEEADTRMILHAIDAGRSSFSDIVIRSPDTDVIVLALAHAAAISSSVIFERTSKGGGLIDITKLANGMGTQLCDALIGFHCFTGCDSVSAFHGKGKKRALDILMGSDVFQHSFADVGKAKSLSTGVISSLEAFVCRLYGQAGDKINDARYRLFCSKSLCEQSLPPTRDALLLHASRANYQAYIHRRAGMKSISPPSPSDHGWIVHGDSISIRWMTKEPAPPQLTSSAYCRCKKSGCENNMCSCKSSGVSCTDLCACAQCKNSQQTVSERDLMADVSESDESCDED